MHRNNFLIRFFNNFYNFVFIKINKLKIKNIEPDIKNKIIKNYDNSRGYETVWLLNLYKLYKIFLKFKNPTKYNFVDIGCGYGIALIYAYKKFNFRSYSGIDIIREYISDAKKNLKLTEIKENKVRFILRDASNLKLLKKSYFLFMFNPFDRNILKIFLKNNKIILKKTSSVIAYANCKDLKLLKKYSKKNIEIKKYNLVLFFF